MIKEPEMQLNKSILVFNFCLTLFFLFFNSNFCIRKRGINTTILLQNNLSFWTIFNLAVALKLPKNTSDRSSQVQTWLGIPDHGQLKLVLSWVSFSWWLSLFKKAKILSDFLSRYCWILQCNWLKTLFVTWK